MSADDTGLDVIAFADAMAELKAILDELEGEDVDIDRLAANVRRAATLISTCRERIMAVEMEIEQIVAELDDDPDS